MKPTSLSPEFYENLYNEIINQGFEPENEDDCHCNMDIEDVDGFFVNLDVTFEVKFVDDSFDHAFGTEYGYHFECGPLSDIEAVSISDEDGNDLSDLFDNDKFWAQFKKYEIKFFNGAVVKSGDKVLCGYNYNQWSEVVFLYRDTLQEVYVCVPVGKEDNCINRRHYKRMRPCA